DIFPHTFYLTATVTNLPLPGVEPEAEVTPTPDLTADSLVTADDLTPDVLLSGEDDTSIPPVTAPVPVTVPPVSPPVVEKAPARKPVKPVTISPRLKEHR
ncbi:MAG: hypothetical protein ACREHG_07390, partial [Candidatus Saccharimonadales bacterium]